MRRQVVELVRKVYAHPEPSYSREEAEAILVAAVWNTWRTYDRDAEEVWEAAGCALQALYDHRALDAQPGMENFFRECWQAKKPGETESGSP